MGAPPAEGPPRQEVAEEPAPLQRQTSPGEPTQNTPMLNLYCAWCISFLTAIDGTVSVPSMWKYVQSLGGSHFYYGLCVSAFALGRLSCMGIFGFWADRRPYKEVFVVSLMISMLAGVLYAAAPTVGIWAIVAGRGLLGAMSAQSVATQAFVFSNTSAADRTHYIGVFTLVSNTLQVAGPGFNLFIVMLPRFTINIGSYTWFFNNYTWVGYFLFCGQLLCLAFLLCCFREPPRRSLRRAPPLGPCGTVLTLGGFFPLMRVFIDSWLHKTGAWFIFVSNFRNSFTANSVNYVIPLITDRDYGWGQLENSYIFVALSIESIISVCILRRLSKSGVYDRTLMVMWGMCCYTGLLAYVLCSGFGTKAIPIWLFFTVLVWYDFGTSMPPTQALYSKLIGRKANQGLYVSVLQSNGAISNMIAGQLVGAAYGSLGAPFLWAATHGLWGLSWVATCSMWRKLHPTYIEEMHQRLGDPSCHTASLRPVGEEAS